MWDRNDDRNSFPFLEILWMPKHKKKINGNGGLLWKIIKRHILCYCQGFLEDEITLFCYIFFAIYSLPFSHENKLNKKIKGGLQSAHYFIL